MKNILEWIQNPDRDYQEGVKMYDKHKLNAKHDKFFATPNPEAIHKNMLLSRMMRIYQKMNANPNIAKDEAKPEPIKIKKIEPVQAKQQASPVSSRKNKQYINKLLALNWDDLSFNDKKIFFNNEKYFLVKKSLMLENGDIERKMRSLHAKVKAIDPDPKNDEKRGEIMSELATLDDTKAANWKTIDTWNEPEGSFAEPENTTKQAVQKALEREKKIKANKIYIYRAEKTLDDMPEKTAKQKAKKQKKADEIAKRKAELKQLGEPYKAK